ncbi:MAG TPA: hypothetical protein VFF81_02630 [Noviherbaspirillum sp.]|nr:hypothetical protein [Noviherbaspirillum sp.]
MSTLGNESAKPDAQDISASLPIDESTIDLDRDPAEDSPDIPPPSEVKQRIDLLGKLIIPRSVR